jgi:hypothetical protein
MFSQVRRHLLVVGVVQHPEGLELADEPVRLRHLDGDAGETPMSPHAETGIVLLAICALLVTTVFVGARWREKTGGLGQVPPPAPEYARRITALRDEDYDNRPAGAPSEPRSTRWG